MSKTESSTMIMSGSFQNHDRGKALDHWYPIVVAFPCVLCETKAPKQKCLMIII